MFPFLELVLPYIIKMAGEPITEGKDSESQQIPTSIKAMRCLAFSLEQLEIRDYVLLKYLYTRIGYLSVKEDLNTNTPKVTAKPGAKERGDVPDVVFKEELLVP